MKKQPYLSGKRISQREAVDIIELGFPFSDPSGRWPSNTKCKYQFHLRKEQRSKNFLRHCQKNKKRDRHSINFNDIYEHPL